MMVGTVTTIADERFAPLVWRLHRSLVPSGMHLLVVDVGLWSRSSQKLRAHGIDVVRGEDVQARDVTTYGAHPQFKLHDASQVGADALAHLRPSHLYRRRRCCRRQHHPPLDTRPPRRTREPRASGAVSPIGRHCTLLASPQCNCVSIRHRSTSGSGSQHRRIGRRCRHASEGWLLVGGVFGNHPDSKGPVCRSSGNFLQRCCCRNARGVASGP